MSIVESAAIWQAIEAGISAVAAIISACAIVAFFRQSKHAAEQTRILAKQLANAHDQADILRAQLDEQQRSSRANATMMMLLEPQREVLYDELKTVLKQEEIANYVAENTLTPEQVELIEKNANAKRVIRRYLGRLEQLCLYVNMGVLDEEMTRRLIGTRVRSTCIFFLPWITYLQKNREDQENAYCELVSLATKWERLKASKRSLDSARLNDGASFLPISGADQSEHVRTS